MAWWMTFSGTFPPLLRLILFVIFLFFTPSQNNVYFSNLNTTTFFLFSIYVLFIYFTCLGWYQFNSFKRDKIWKDITYIFFFEKQMCKHDYFLQNGMESPSIHLIKRRQLLQNRNKIKDTTLSPKIYSLNLDFLIWITFEKNYITLIIIMLGVWLWMAIGWVFFSTRPFLTLIRRVQIMSNHVWVKKRIFVTKWDSVQVDISNGGLAQSLVHLSMARTSHNDIGLRLGLVWFIIWTRTIIFCP